MIKYIHMGISAVLIFLFLPGMGHSFQADAIEPAPPGRTLTFVYTRPQNHPVTQWLVFIYTEALRRMHIKFVLLDVPPKRASLYSNKGEVDGELGRIYHYNKTNPNLIRVEEHHSVVKFTAYASDPKITLDGWESLQGKNHLVSYRSGIKKCEIELTRVVSPKRLSDITRIQQGMQMLLSGRTDLYVDVEDYARKYLSSDEFKNISHEKKIYKAGLMEKTTGHAFLHKRHRTLAPKLAAILRTMKAKGEFRQYLFQAGLSPEDIYW